MSNSEYSEKKNLKVSFQEPNPIINLLIDNSSSGNINFRFFIVEGRDLLKKFHLKILLILKKFMEKFIYDFKNNFIKKKYNIDILVHTVKMNVYELGSATILKYIKDDNNSIIITSSLLNINSLNLTSHKNDPKNILLAETLLHELIHSLGFGYWDMFLKSNLISNNSIISNNINKNFQKIIKYPINHGIPLSYDNTHINIYNKPIIKDNKIIGIIPALKYEIMSNNDTTINFLSKISASILSELGYSIDYSLCDEYSFTKLPTSISIEYTLPTTNHFANNFEKYILLFKKNEILMSGIETFSLNINQKYVIKNNYEYKIFIVDSLDEKNYKILNENDGVTNYSNGLTFIPKKEGMFYIVSNITFAGIPIIVNNSLKTYEECFNKQSIRNIVKSLIHIS